MRYIAYCNDIFAFQCNRVLDAQWAKRVTPCILWVSHLSGIVKSQGYTVVTGDVALSHVQAGYWRAEDILVIQEQRARSADKLIEFGAKQWILIYCESPLIAFLSYDHFMDMAEKFEYGISFSGLFRNHQNNNGGKFHQLYFPTYRRKELDSIKDWNERKFMVLVAANKYWKVPFRFSLDPYVHLKFFYGMLRRRLSRSWRIAVRDELQTKRLELIEYFGTMEKIDVYGKGWNELEKLPRQWRTKLGVLLESALSVQNKVKTISEYKFSVCFENVAYPGYFTEKIIDCFIAGVVPIYLGAHDIENYVPREAYIDMRNFGSLQELEEYLDEFSETSAMRMISAGREYLESPRGKLHTVEGFAEFIGNLLPQFNN